MQSDGNILSLVALTPLILFCAVGVIEQWRYMVTTLRPTKDMPQVILLLGGMGWMKLGIIFGVFPDALGGSGLVQISPWVEACTNTISAMVLTFSIILMRSAQAVHVKRVAAIYAIVLGVVAFASFTAFVPFGWRLP